MASRDGAADETGREFGELVVERPARVTRVTSHLLEHEVAVAIARQALRRRLEQGLAGPGSPLGLRWTLDRPQYRYIHACLLVSSLEPLDVRL
jgi:hypothetical protein